LLRDIGTIHANSTFADLPKEVQAAITASVRSAFNRLLKEGYAVAPAGTEAARGGPPRHVPAGPRGRSGPGGAPRGPHRTAGPGRGPGGQPGGTRTGGAPSGGRPAGGAPGGKPRRGR
jgi:hypothetical protein